MSLRIVPNIGLELVLPQRMSLRAGERFVRQQQAWIEQHAELLTQAMQPKIITPPQYIDLQFLAKKFPVRYEAYADAGRVLLHQVDEGLIFKGATHEWSLCLSALKRWLRRLARKHLSLRLQELSSSCGLPFNKLTLRDQSTRWGSCSSQKNISLNMKLLFLPKQLVDYVLIHELCHTRVLDHSQKFWNLVGSYLPNYQQLRRTLRDAEHLIEDWYDEN